MARLGVTHTDNTTEVYSVGPNEEWRSWTYNNECLVLYRNDKLRRSGRRHFFLRNIRFLDVEPEND